MKTATYESQELSQISAACRKIQSSWSQAERAERRREGEARRLQLMQMLGLIEAEVEAQVA